MSGFCGWLRRSDTMDQSPDQLNTMLQGIPCNGSPITVQQSPFGAFGFSQAPNLHCDSKQDTYILLQGECYSLTSLNRKITQSPKDILEGYLRLGPQFIHGLKGHFALAILIMSTQEVFLASDPLGTFTLYYYTKENALKFSTHCKAIAMGLAHSLKLNTQSLYDYFYFHMIPSPHTLYEDIHRLPAGHYVLFRQGSVKVVPYWTPAMSPAKRSYSKNKEQLMLSLDHAFEPLGTIPNIGTFLSGGIDSTTLLAWLSQAKSGSVPAFTIGFDEDQYNETEFARLAAEHFKAKHYCYQLTPKDVETCLGQLACQLDQPFGNASMVPSLFCAKLAKENGVSHLVAGDGGDELFGGNSRYATLNLLGLYQTLPKLMRKGIIEPLIFGLGFAKGFWPIRKLTHYIEQANTPLPDRQEAYNLLNRLKASEVLCADFLNEVDPLHPIEHLRQLYQNAEASSSLGKMLCLDWKITLMDNDLIKVRQACQMAGIEVSFPLLDPALIELSLQLSDPQKVKGTQLRVFYKKAMSQILPKAVLNKSKHGFGLPIGAWTLKNPSLKNLVFDTLNQFNKRHIVNPKFMTQLMDHHLIKYPAYYGAMVWLFVILEQWLVAQQSSFSQSDSIHLTKPFYSGDQDGKVA